jgi:hypothetical protein
MLLALELIVVVLFLSAYSMPFAQKGRERKGKSQAISIGIRGGTNASAATGLSRQKQQTQDVVST